MGKRDLRSIRTRRAIIDAMFQLLAEKPFDKITIQDICDAAAISRTAFYLHFEDKYHLMVDCLEEIFNIVPSRNESLEALCENLLDGVYNRRKALRNLHRYGATKELEEKVTAMLLSVFQRYYRYQEAAGGYEGAPVELIAVFNCGGICSLLFWWVANDYATTKEEMKCYLLTKMRQSLSYEQL